MISRWIVFFFICKWPNTLAWTSFHKDVNERFQIFWNIPSEVCANTSTGPIRPNEYGIRTNEGERFYGNEIVTFYEDRLGLYPKCLYIKNKNGSYEIIKYINGGLPTADTLDMHLVKAAMDIAAAIPDEQFSGLAIIDYEHWRPMFAHNWGPRSVYKVEAIRRIRRIHPLLNESAAATLAEATFNQNAKSFMLETLRLGKRMRPNAKWGFYDFPLCDYKINAYTFGADHRRCHNNFLFYNNEMMWLYKEIVALYPPIYFYVKPQNSSDLRVQRNYVYAKIAESQRIASILDRYIPTYLFSKNEYDEYAPEPKFYTKESRCIAFGIPAFFGVPAGTDNITFKHNFTVKGIVIWSTSTNMRSRCPDIKNAMRRGLGKFLFKYFHRSAKCDYKLCSGNGRCVTKTVEFVKDHTEEEPFICHHEIPLPEHMRCICDAGYSGDHCEYIKKSPFFAITTSTTTRLNIPLKPNTINVSQNRPRRLFKIWRYRRTL